MSSLPISKAVGPSELAQLSTLALRARTIVEGTFAGLHHTPDQGSAIEFAEHKEYAPGDDIRRIDWKAFGRHDRYHIKLFEDETQLQTVCVLDASASMGYGTGGISKLTYATYIASAFCYLVAQQGDATGLTLFDTAIRKTIASGVGSKQLFSLFEALDTAQPVGGTDLAQTLAHLGDTLSRRSLVVVFSDLLDPDPKSEDPNAPDETKSGDRNAQTFEKLTSLRKRGHDVAVFHVMHPDEIDLPFNSLCRFEGLEPGDQRVVIADPDDLRESFKEASERFRTGWRDTCRRAGIDYEFSTTIEPPAALLRRFLAGRQNVRVRS